MDRQENFFKFSTPDKHGMSLDLKCFLLEAKVNQSWLANFSGLRKMQGSEVAGFAGAIRQRRHS